MSTVIIGAGPAGLAAGMECQKKNIPFVLYEQNDFTGGLCHSFQIEGFTFDTFVHLSFTKDQAVKEIFDRAHYSAHVPEIQNYWNGKWLRHPVQNNLYFLPVDEKIKIIKSFLERSNQKEPGDYEEWLRGQYGNYFTENFPMKYTRKYWCLNAKDMGTEWVGNRMTRPDLDEVLRGALEENALNNYYASEMRYPVQGGYERFLAPMKDGLDMRLNKKVISINADQKEISFSDGTKDAYDRLISTMPLPELCRCLNAGSDIMKACDKLAWTKGVIVSIGTKGDHVYPFEQAGRKNNPVLWFYIYDEDIPFARAYYPGRKAKSNVPEGCSALQVECYYHCKRDFPNPDWLKAQVIQSLEKMQVLSKSDILFADIRFQEYANIIFDHNIYGARKLIRNYLHQKEIICAGRFGEWDYFWSDQSILSGINAVASLK